MIKVVAPQMAQRVVDRAIQVATLHTYTFDRICMLLTAK